MIPTLCFSQTTTIEIPENRSKDKPEKYVFKEQDLICHNKTREKAINDKLTTQNLALDACEKYKALALDVKPEVSLGLFPEFKWGEFTIGIAVGGALIYYLRR